MQVFRIEKDDFFSFDNLEIVEYVRSNFRNFYFRLLAEPGAIFFG